MFNVLILNNANVQLYVDYYDANDQIISGNSITKTSPTNGYLKLDNIHVTPAGTASMRIYALLRATEDGGSGRFYVDTMTVRKTTDQPSNFSFERTTGAYGVADDWSLSISPSATSQMSRITTPVQEGARAQKVSVSNLPAGEYAALNQWVLAEPNVAYALTGQFYVESLNDAKVQLYIDCYDRNGSWLQGRPVDYAETTGGYVQLQNEMITPPDTAFLRIYAVLRGLRDGAGGTMYVDNMQLKKTAAPALLTPRMLSQNTPIGVITSTPDEQGYNRGYSALDQNTSTYWRSERYGSLEYDFGTPATVREFAVVNTSASASPEGVALRGYNAQTDKWDVLYQHPITSGMGWRENERKTFPIQSPGAYTKYRFSYGITNGPAITHVAELELLGEYSLPVTPKGLTNTTNGNGEVNLSWRPVNGAAYNVYQDGVKVNSLPISGTEWKINGLTNCQVYHYQISAVNDKGESPLSASVVGQPYSTDNNLIPKMTSNTAPTGLASALQEYRPAYYAFDRNPATAWQANASNLEQTLAYDFPTPVKVNQYILQQVPTNAINNKLYNWKFQAFDETLQNWVTLDTRSNINNWTDGERKGFTFENENFYSKYRLYAAALTNTTVLSIAGFEMIGVPQP